MAEVDDAANRAALMARARVAPPFADAVHSTDTAHATLQDDLLTKRSTLQATVLALETELGELVAKRQALAAKREQRSVTPAAEWDAAAAAQAIDQDADMRALIGSRIQRHRTLQMHRAATRELVLASGAFWGDGDALQRAVTKD